MFLANRKSTKQPLGDKSQHPKSNNECTKKRQKKPQSTEKGKKSEVMPSPRPEMTSKDAKKTPPMKNPYEAQTGWRWMTSWAKEILREAIMKGDILPEHTHDEIHGWHPEVELTDRKKLPGRIRALRQQVAHDSDAAEDDALALAHDRKLYPMPTHNHRGEPRWQGSAAERKLKADIVANHHLTMTPHEFYKSRPEYEEYSGDVIREHLYQEVKFQKYCHYRNVKRQSQYVKFVTKK